LNRLLDLYCKLLDGLIVVFLAIMVVLVFGNVVLRYAFNSGITVSEEVSRWLFVWVTFMGAVVALRQHAHLGTDFMVSRLGPAGKKACLVVAHVGMLYAAGLLGLGSWRQVVINADVSAPVTGWPVAIVYAAGLLFAVSAVVILGLGLLRVLSGAARDDELVLVKEEGADEHAQPADAAALRTAGDRP
jgi:TRAP-type C4-dicarboxylate transport system permease small subunit